MADSAALGLPADLAQPGSLLHTILTMSLTAVAVLRPLYESDGHTIRDFALLYLNPAGQQLLQLPEQPTGSLLTLFSSKQEVGGLAFYRAAFHSGQVERHQQLYQADGVAGCYPTVAQRYQDLLLVNFAGPNEPPHSVAEAVLRESEAREQQARAETERQRAALQRINQELEARVQERTRELADPLAAASPVAWPARWELP